MGVSSSELFELLEVFKLSLLELAEIAWQRGSSGLNTNTLAYKLRLDEESTGLTRHQQAYVCGLALEGGSDIV